ncbi:MAG: hypothetical protein ACOYN4_00870 [Bacteroidales bacterium]
MNNKIRIEADMLDDLQGCQRGCFMYIAFIVICALITIALFNL